MREILGRRRRTRSELLSAALVCAEQWHWPVVPGAGTRTRQIGPMRQTPRTRTPSRLLSRLPGLAGLLRPKAARSAPGARGRGEAVPRPPGERQCACPRPDCAVPGAHPHDPGLLAATTDARMVRWWWTNRPDAPIVLATGTSVAAVSLPAVAGIRALAVFDRAGVRLGPVAVSPTRVVLLVRPYSLEALGELLSAHDWVPTSLRYHGSGGYVVLPPSTTGGGGLTWERAPAPGQSPPWLPTIESVVNTLVAASATEPDGSRLAY